MKELQKIIGRAGSGKTHTMIEQIADLLESGISPARIGMITYSRNGAAQFVMRAVALSEEYNEKHFKYFRTMHSMSSSLIGWRPEEKFAAKHWKMFYARYYPDISNMVEEIDEDEYWLKAVDKDRLMSTHRFVEMEEIHDLLLNAMIDDFDFDELYRSTGRDLTYRHWYVSGEKPVTKASKGGKESITKLEIVWDKMQGRITPEDMVEFSKNYTEFKEEEELMTFTDVIKSCYDLKYAPPVDYLFVDEFQDFSRLQYALFTVWRDAIDYVWIAGDDAQTVNRWAAADATFFINESVVPVNNVVKLKQTYRHGATIFNNAQKYIEAMTVVQEVDVLPHPDMEGVVTKVYGGEWKEHLVFGEKESVLILAATNKWFRSIKNQLKGLTPDIVWTVMGEDKIVERVIKQYNVIADLERGELVPWDRIAPLIIGDNPLPTKMSFMERISTLSGVEDKKYKNEMVLKWDIKSEIRKESVTPRDNYTKKTFQEDFMKRNWNGWVLMANIKDLPYFPQALEHFPKKWNVDGVSPSQHRIGTIHRSKGDEADIVIIFMAVPYPSEEMISMVGVRDDMLRQFYVGTSRPRIKLIEVYDYLKHGLGSYAKDPMSLI